MYKPKDSAKSPRFTGTRTFMRLEEVRTTENVDFAIVGVPFDTAVSNRTGQRYGPQHIRDFSVLFRPYNPVQDIDVFEYCSGVDYGDISIVPGNIHRSYDNIVEELTPMLENGVTPIILGGDHSISLGNLRAMAKVYGPVSLVHFDSHVDTSDHHWGEKYTHGTPFRRAVEEGLIDTEHSIQVGIRGSLYTSQDVKVSKDLGFEVIPVEELHKIGYQKVIERIRKRVGNSGQPVFVSYDIDFIDPAFAPGTGTPEVGGPNSFEALEYVRGLKDLNIKGFDLVEVLPSYDHGGITAALASAVAFEMATLVALQKRKEMENTAR